MKRHIALVYVALVILVAGCGSLTGTTPTQTTTADVQLTSIGQETVDNGKAVEVVGVAKNYGDAEADTTAVITLLDGGSEIAEAKVPLGVLSPGESASFSATIEADASEVTGRTITFE